MKRKILGDTEMSDREEKQTRQQAGKNQQRHHGHERRFDGPIDRARHDAGAERAEYRRRYLLRTGEHPRIAARSPNQQTEDDAAEQHHAGALYGEGQQGSVEDDGRESETVNDNDRSHQEPDGKCPEHLGRQQVGAKLRQSGHAIIQERFGEAVSPINATA